MLLKYKTGRLPFNFIALGILLLAVSIWRIIILDWFGIIYLLISVFFLLIESGFIIDTNNLKLKKYIGFLNMNSGKWVNINNVKNLEVVRAKVSQRINVLSISRVDSKVIYKLRLVFSSKKLELMMGEKEKVNSTAKEISNSLNITVDNRVKEN